jgi:DNA-binding NarL/FixJ family response regulator
MNDTPKTRVVLVDDHELIRQGLARAFERDPNMAIVGQAGSVVRALAAYEEHRPDVIVTDLQLPDGTGLDVIRAIRQQDDKIGLVVLTMHAGDDQIFAGARGGRLSLRGQGRPRE